MKEDLAVKARAQLQKGGQGVVSAIPAGNNSAACHGDIQTATWSDIEDSNPFYHHGFRQRCTRRRTRLDRRR
jgi:hypothetical protein